MGIYKRAESRYWWMHLEPTGTRESTKIPIVGASPEQTKRYKGLALAAYHAKLTTLKQRDLGLLPPEPNPRTFVEQADWYAEHVAAHKRGKERELFTLGKLRDDFWDRRLVDMDAATVHEWMTRRKASVSASTVNREVDVLKRILASAVPKYLPASPLAGLPRLRAPRGEAPKASAILTRAQEDRLLAVLTPEDRALVLLAICTLFRLSDVLDLKWADYHGTWIEAVSPKTGKPIKVPVATRAREAVNALPKSRTEPYLFPARRAGTPAQRRNRIKMLLRWACQKARVPYGRAKGGITFHSFRHTGATRMLLAGVDPRTVQEIGGWASLVMVMRYTHPTQRGMRAAVERI